MRFLHTEVTYESFVKILLDSTRGKRQLLDLPKDEFQEDIETLEKQKYGEGVEKDLYPVLVCLLASNSGRI